MIARRSISMVLVWLCAVAGGLLLWSAPALAQREHVYSSSFGSEGSGNGQFSRPGELAVGEVGPTAGDVYVIDRGNGRVEIFSATGAYVGQFNGSESPTGAFSWPEALLLEGAIAIDNSTNPLDPSAGDVYVADTGHKAVDKFNAKGVYLGQLTGPSASAPFGLLEGIAVADSGSLWVQVNNVGGREGLDEFNDAAANEYVSDNSLRMPSTFGDLGDIGLALDAEGNIYLGRKESTAAKLNREGALLNEEVDGEEATGVAVDQSSSDVYVDNRTSVAAVGPSGSFIERFGSAQLTSSEGVAVNSATGTVYTSDAANQAVEIFTSFVVPDVSTGAASSLRETSADLSGSVNPDGLPVSSCVFEYGTSGSYGQEVPCAQDPAAIGSGGAPVSVSASLSGLEPVTRYHFRLKVVNANGSNEGQDGTFVTPVPVVLGEESVADVSSSSALFGAQVDPGGSDTTFRFEYGTSASYGASVPVPDGDLGSGTSSEPVSIGVQGLLPGATYHVRIVAMNLLGTVYGPDKTFTTQSAGGLFVLPDDRMWELVSPPAKDGASIALFEQGVVEAAENGSGITYLMNGPIVENPSGNLSPFDNAQVLSRRGAGGSWSTQDIATPYERGAEGTTGPGYRFFSSDLSDALLESGTTLMSPEATEPTWYIRDDGTGGYLPLVTAANVPAGTKFGLKFEQDNLVGIAGTPDLSHVLISAQAPLTENATTGNLYEWEDGRLTLVSVLPDGKAATGGVYFGAKSENIRHAISNDGSRVFWLAFEEEEGLYMTDTVTGKSVKVDAPAPGVAQPPISSPCYQTASATGSKVFFTEGEPLTADSKLSPNPYDPRCEAAEGGAPKDLYVYDTEAKTLTDLTVDRAGAEPANVQNMVLGASEDGSIVYFLATGKLAEGAVAGKDNLYVESETGSTWSAPRLVAVLSQEDESTWAGTEPNTFFTFYDSTTGLASEVSADGHFLTFMSDQSLTGYDNRDASGGHPDEEVFLYDEASGRLSCVSCNPTGARPTGVFVEKTGQYLSIPNYFGEAWRGRWLAADIPTWNESSGIGQKAFSAYQPRYLTDEGRMYFTSFDSLVAQDTNGKADVYEYEPEAVGSCRQSGGCVSLISSGTSGEESAFLDASGKGPGGEEAEDVFFVTASRLTSQDYDSSYDVYDAHTCSQAVPCVSTPVSPPECSSGDSCKAAPSPQPAIFGAPASATFSGSGNPQPAPAAVSPKKAVKKNAKHKAKQKRPRKRRAKRSTAHGSRSLRARGAKGKGR